MALPQINVWSVDQNSIFLNWPVQDISTVNKYNLYGSASTAGPFTLRIANIPNIVTNRTVAAGAVLVEVSRTDFSIDPSQPFYFKITSIDPSDVESSLGLSPFVSVDSLDDIFKQRLTDDDNPVYKNIMDTVDTGDVDKEIDINQLLGRDANYIEIKTDNDFSVKLNSKFNDPISVSSATGFLLRRQTLRINTIFVSGGGANAAAEIFVSGI